MQINEAGRRSNDQRNEGQLVCDVLGLESLVDEITSKLLSSSHAQDTPSAILGPFYRANAPFLANGSSIVHVPAGASWAKQAEAELTLVRGRVVSAATGRPIAGAVVDVWHTAPNGKYEQQDAEQQDMNLRGRFAADADGRYSFLCLRPVPYPIPFDGPAGDILALLDRHHFRPGHIHFIVRAPGYRTLTTQVFDRRDAYLNDDAVFAVKRDLLVDFEPVHDPGKSERFRLLYDFKLARESQT